MKVVDLTECKWCNGSGYQREDLFDTGYDCPDCEGTGFKYGKKAEEYQDYMIELAASEND